MGQLLQLVKLLFARPWELGLYLGAGVLTLVSFAVRGHWVALHGPVVVFLDYYVYDIAGPTLVVLLARTTTLAIYRPVCRLAASVLGRPMPQRLQLLWVTQRPLAVTLFGWGAFMLIELVQWIGMPPGVWSRLFADVASWGDLLAYSAGALMTAVCLLRQAGLERGEL